MLKKILAVFPVFIIFVFSGLFVFAGQSSPVLFQTQPQTLADQQKQDLIWEWIKSELRNKYTYLDFSNRWKSLFAAAHSDDYNKIGSELEQKVKDKLLLLFAAAKTKNKTGALQLLLKWQDIFLSGQRWTWNTLVDDGVGEPLLNPQYAYLAKTLILIKKKGKEYKGSLEPLFLAAKRFGFVKTWEEFAKIKIPGFREIIWDFRFLFSVGEREINAAFAATDSENKPKLNNLWTAIKDELKKPEYAHLSKNPILINNEGYDLKLLFDAAHDFIGNGYDLPLATKMQLQDLVNANIDGENFKVTLTATALDFLWSEIKSELKTKYAHLSKTPILVNGNNYNLEPLFAAAKDNTQYEKKGSELSVQAKDKLQWLVGDVVIPQKFKDALAKTALVLLWFGIKDELQRPEYAHLVNLPISIEGKLYNLELLFAAASKDLLLEPEELEKLSELVQNKITSQQFKDALAKTTLDLLWSEIKSELKKPEYAYLSKTPITIKGKEYDLDLLFVAAKDDAQYEKKGSELPASEKDKLQELFNAKVGLFHLLNSLKFLNSKRLTVFQKLWINQPSSFHYLLWLPLFKIQNLTINQMDLTVGQLGSEVAGMLADQKLDFINLSEKGKQELLSLLNEVGSLSEVVKTAVWKQVQNSEKWKKITDANSIATIMRIKKLLAEEVVELNIKKVDHPFFPQGYDLSFLQDVVTWKDTPLKQLLSGISIRIENNNVIFTSHLFPDQPVLKLPFNKIMSVFDQLTLESIESTLQTKVATKLDDYKNSIQINLKNFFQNDIFQIQFKKQNYSIKNLIAEINLAKSGSELEGSARKELINLFSGDLNSSILEDILEARDSVQKKETDQSLLIVLTVVGTILGVSGIGVFFLFFFTRR